MAIDPEDPSRRITFLRPGPGLLLTLVVVLAVATLVVVVALECRG